MFSIQSSFYPYFDRLMENKGALFPKRTSLLVQIDHLMEIP